ncbi:MAG: single-stranded DNA-binding protein [Pleomorphochaeta sp.]
MSRFDDFNFIVIEGRLTKDPILRNFKNNNCVCTFTIAVNSSYKGKDESYVQEVGFFDIDVWNNAARACNQYLKKGCKIRVKGALKLRKWENSDGSKKSKVYIKADNVEFSNNEVKSSCSERGDKNGEIETSLGINITPTF